MKKSFCNLSHLQMAFGFTLLVSGVAIGQMRTITGTVTENNQPVKGVSVFQEGKEEVAVTNAAGVYRVQVSGENPVIIYRHPDYPERKITLGSRITVNISLGKEKEIEEVVLNAGYYKVKNKERTGSIAKISAKDIENQPVTNVLASAQGRMSGVSITQNSGTPGGGFDIQIRGKNSIRREGNEPLYIIDGVPQASETPSLYSNRILPWSSINPLNAINPNDIESFEILKDADATAIYGSRGANGVIIVTTKRGKKGRSELKLNTSYSLSRITRPMELMNTEQYISMRKQGFQNDNVPYPATMYDINGTWDQSRYTDWQKELIGGTADAYAVQLSLSGGSEITSYNISYGHNEQSTVLPADFRYRTDNVNANFSYFTPDRRLEFNFVNMFSFQKNNVQNDDLTLKSITLSPNAPALYNTSGNINWENGTFTNPVASFLSEYINKTAFFNNGLNVSYKLFPFLSVKMNAGISYQNFEERSLKPHTINNPALGQTSLNSTSSKNNQVNFSYILEPQVVGTYQFGNHQFEALVGTTLQKTQSDQGAITGRGFESNALIDNIGAASVKTISDQVRSEYNYTAVFARFNYQLKKRYILNLTGRRDGSSRFGPNNRFGNFGALGGAWLFSEENFLRDSKWLTLGKIRGSIGTTGNDKIGDYQYLNTYIISSNIYNGQTGLNPARLYNPNFSWEKTVKKEVAMELGFWKGRFNFSGAYYENTSSNQLVGIPLPATTGFSSIQSNLPAKIRNTGWEFDTSIQVLKNGKFRYDTSFNLSIPRNTLVEFPNLEGSTYSNQYVIGYPTTIARVYQYEGIDPATGLYKFKDFNGDGKINSPDDNKAVEKLGVRMFGGWSSQFRFGQWSASFLWQFVKQRNWNYNRQMLMPGTLSNQPVEVLDAWSPSNPEGTYMQYSAGYNPQKLSLHGFFQNSTAAVSDASYIRLKNVQVNYRIPVDRMGIKEAMVYFQGQNLLTITDYFGMDPEFYLVGYLPPLKTYSLGFQVTF
ncbi:SusC/RagA family TonB-linked outer membrane protein [Epilithonimonas tenax]|uniref:SusC/RagA family TonB-linked outer membrane protein n=2 Tax=Chryseobacterium group TaxID=2782232 RepID=UPI00047FCCDD|nr:SusC/RagA family TonB-linked outer membrane protein [Epilithonimonas tenax]